MNILVVAATSFEVQAFAESHPSAEILITGVGIPYSMYSLTEYLQNKKFDVIIQAGVAGAFDRNILLSKVFIVKEDVFATTGILEKNEFITLSEAKLKVDSDIFIKDKLINTGKILNTISLPFANSITVDTVTDNKDLNNLFQKKYSAGLESMEGAVLHYVALKKKIPFLQIRSVSNYVGERDKSKWQLQPAIKSLNIELSKIYNYLIKQ